MGDEESKSDKRLRMQKERKKRNIKIFIVVLVVIIIAAVAVGAYVATRSTDDEPDVTILDSSLGNFTHKITDLPENDLYFFQYDHDGTIIEYFVAKGTDGDLRCAYNICTCTLDDNEQPGYRYLPEQYKLQCIFQGCTYPLNLVNSGTPGCCEPEYFDFWMSEYGTEIVIEKEDLIKGAHLFEM